MMEWLIVLAYVYSIVENFHNFIATAQTILITLSVVGPVCVAAVYSLVHDKCISKEHVGRWLPYLKKAWYALLILSVIGVMVPNQEGMKYVAGAAIVAYSAEAVSEMEGMDKLPGNVSNLINALIQDITADLQTTDVSEQVKAQAEATVGKRQRSQ